MKSTVITYLNVLEKTHLYVHRNPINQFVYMSNTSLQQSHCLLGFYSKDDDKTLYNLHKHEDIIFHLYATLCFYGSVNLAINVRSNIYIYINLLQIQKYYIIAVVFTKFGIYIYI